MSQILFSEVKIYKFRKSCKIVIKLKFSVCNLSYFFFKLIRLNINKRKDYQNSLRKNVKIREKYLKESIISKHKILKNTRKFSEKMFYNIAKNIKIKIFLKMINYIFLVPYIVKLHIYLLNVDYSHNLYLKLKLTYFKINIYLKIIFKITRQ